jgi:hypothetical protein
MTEFGLLETYRSFGGTYCLHIQGRCRQRFVLKRLQSAIVQKTTTLMFTAVKTASLIHTIPFQHTDAKNRTTVYGTSCSI